MSRELKRPTKRGEVWVHIDRLDRADGCVWAVQVRQRSVMAWDYLTVRHVELRGVWTTRFTGVDGEQPRAYLVADLATLRFSRQGTCAVIASRRRDRRSRPKPRVA